MHRKRDYCRRMSLVSLCCCGHLNRYFDGPYSPAYNRYCYIHVYVYVCIYMYVYICLIFAYMTLSSLERKRPLIHKLASTAVVLICIYLMYNSS